MVSFAIGCLAVTAISLCASYFLFRRLWLRRIEALERDLQLLSDTFCEMAEIELQSFQKNSANLSEIEERILDLSVPSQDSTAPLERRRRVLALSGKGAHLEDIVKKAGVPRGEAELILNLQRCKGVAAAKTGKPNGEGKQYVQA
jgi:hypothetical protein